MKRILMPALATSLLAAACLDSEDPVGNELTCDPVAAPQGSQRGDTLVTSTGLRVLETRQGTGATVRSCQWVRVHYRGQVLGDSVAFDDSRRRGQPLDFVPGVNVPGLGRLITGFEQGVIGAEVGGTRRLIIPPSLGYGNNPPAQSGIAPGATLVFDIEIVANDTTQTF